MGRRKKEPESVHRENISSAAKGLFSKKGVASTTMDEIAKEAGYSKATLYVYFANKEEIVGFLVLKSMKLLLAVLHEAVIQPVSVEERYHKICNALMQYQEQYPLFFTLAVGEINVNFDKEDYLPIEKETYEVGEQINGEIMQFIRSGIDAGEFAPDMPVLETVFLFWASLSGIIQMADNKQSYIEKVMNQSKKQFLEFGFSKLYRLISMGGRV